MTERRINDRYEVHFEARVTALNDPNCTAMGRVSDISASGVRVTLPIQLGVGDLLRVELADSRLYGQVAYSNPDGSSFRTGIEVGRVVLGKTDLSELLQRTLLDVLPEVPGLEPAAAYPG